jgi:hypothetical protein
VSNLFLFSKSISYQVIVMCEATSNCKVTTDCASVKVRDFDRDGYELSFSLNGGQDGPMFMYRDARDKDARYFWLTADELKTLTLGLEIIRDRLRAGEWDLEDDI